MSATISGALDLQVLGAGLWADGLPGWPVARAVLRGDAPWPAAMPGPPPIARLAPAERRRASSSVRVAICVADEACAQAGVDARETLSVFTSTHGELGLTDEICRVLTERPEELSPTRFHNSVHNAASGYWTIGADCPAASTAVSAWHGSFAAGLLEAGVQALSEQRPVLLVAFDAAASGPLASMATSGSLFGAALVVAPVVASIGTAPHAPVLRLRLADGPGEVASPPLAIDSPLAPCLPLFAALAREASSRLALALAPDARLAVELEAGGG